MRVVVMVMPVVVRVVVVVVVAVAVVVVVVVIAVVRGRVVPVVRVVVAAMRPRRLDFLVVVGVGFSQAEAHFGGCDVLLLRDRQSRGWSDLWFLCRFED
jgi:hypothetical protein